MPQGISTGVSSPLSSVGRNAGAACMVVKKKVGRAFTGGKVSVEEQRREGGNPEVCAVFKYCFYMFEGDDRRIEEMAARCRAGEVLCGECKQCLTEKINAFLEKHQARREEAREVVGQMAMNGFEW